MKNTLKIGNVKIKVICSCPKCGADLPPNHPLIKRSLINQTKNKSMGKSKPMPLKKGGKK